MVYRFSWIAGIAGIGLAFWELSFLLRPSSTGTNWQIAILVAVLLSMGITWTALAYQAHVWIAVVANVVAYSLIVGILVAPDTLWVFLPTGETISAIQTELARAFELIQHGVEPVRPVPGLVAMLAGLFWLLGFLLVGGLLNGRPFVATITPLIIALQFVIIDRIPKSLVHIAVFVCVVAFTLVAVRVDERDHGTGRLSRTNTTSHPKKIPSLGIAVLVSATVVAALVAVSTLGESVPDAGMLAWRSPSGYTDGYSGSQSYNLFTDIRANLISQSNNPLFTATISGDIDPTKVRFRMVTLDRFDGSRWRTGRIQAFPVDEDPWIYEAQKYRGPTTDVTAAIRIENLSMPWLPTPVTPTAVFTDDESDRRALRNRPLDGSLYLPGDLSHPGQEYAVTAEVPTFTGSDLAQLTRSEDGRLSPLFAAAQADGHVIVSPPEVPAAAELPDRDYWTDYPEDVGSLVTEEARDITKNLNTNFERALALENYFRDSGGFTYDTQIPSDFTTDSISDWLFDETNEFARHGYCEQFALTMAVMARIVGMPSRVVIGFTPGRPINDDTVLVEDRNAHSWVEIWIPSHGWMTFDPTPRADDFALPSTNDAIVEQLGFSAADYASLIPEGTDITASNDPNDPTNPAIDPRDDFESVDVSNPTSSAESASFAIPEWVRPAAIALGILVLIASTVPLTKWVRRKRRMRRLAKGDITAAWEDITERLTDLGERVDPAATPYETAESLDAALVPLAEQYGLVVYGEKGSNGRGH
ncbi:MAG: DUF3488 and transglutaminase-like domain-containing protein [Acidimicrobiia bacterium]|nr:DUF3488 and transglutaminase-like domain-containing protein [Acidimicrobiia bacterium]